MVGTHLSRRTVLSILGGASLASLAGCTTLSRTETRDSPDLNCQITYGPWPTAGANAQRTHIAGPDAHLPDADADLSQLTGRSGDAIQGGVTSPPAVSESGVFLASKTGTLAQIDGDWSAGLGTQVFLRRQPSPANRSTLRPAGRRMASTLAMEASGGTLTRRVS